MDLFSNPCILINIFVYILIHMKSLYIYIYSKCICIYHIRTHEYTYIYLHLCIYIYAHIDTCLYMPSYLYVHICTSSQKGTTTCRVHFWFMGFHPTSRRFVTLKMSIKHLEISDKWQLEGVSHWKNPGETTFPELHAGTSHRPSLLPSNP